MKFIFATSNPNKVREVNEMLGQQFEVQSLKDIGVTEDIPETADTFEGNALQKARWIYERYNCDCFSEDTGLEVEALHMAPGVITARYAGPSRDANDNMDLVLKNLKGQSNRKAQFRTAVALIVNGKEYVFEGICKGKITQEKIGEGGFGYDPIFIPEGYTQTFAELPKSVKNEVSHRAKAVAHLVNFLTKE